MQEVKQLVLDLHGQFASFQEAVSTVCERSSLSSKFFKNSSEAAAPLEGDLEDPLDAVLVSALEGIKLAFSMDNPLRFPTMSPVSRE